MSNIEKFKALVSSEKTNTIDKNRARIKNRAMLRESQNIALKVLDKLDEIGWSQRKLAIEMGVSPQQITKIVKGQENLTLETQIKLQNILNIPILASFYEVEETKMISEEPITKTEKYIQLEYNVFLNDYSHQVLQA
jgi:transcriptional regulator with XRE-family HTH domain